MNVIELIKSLGPKADTKKIWVIGLPGVEGHMYYRDVGNSESGWGLKIENADAFPIQAAANNVAIKLFPDNPSPFHGEKPLLALFNLAELGLSVQWDSEFTDDHNIKLTPDLVDNSDHAVSFKVAVAEAKNAAKQELEESRVALKDALNAVKDAGKAFVQAKKDNAKLLANIAIASGAKPKKKPAKKKIGPQVNMRKFGKVKEKKKPKKKFKPLKAAAIKKKKRK